MTSVERRPGQNLTPRQREQYVARASGLILQGKTEREIAAELGVSHSSVGRFWVRHREDVQEELQALIEREMEKLDLIEAEHWKAYQASRGDGPVGDTSHLDRVMAVMQERARRVGLYPPKQVAAAILRTEGQSHDHSDA